MNVVTGLLSLLISYVVSDRPRRVARMYVNYTDLRQGIRHGCSGRG